ncbi:hypothetical protein RchiOBHm_Chr3g0474351 [Rosa chinensis]|uniref:Secreted protein n=1 Tax=Rosa chinensis TaxID=74649 RepID=A0A2P6RC41_ROSCH|nr:hypothetical protein RchiOBHm_Chr3g0474351 [Rosa chinensis]
MIATNSWFAGCFFNMLLCSMSQCCCWCTKIRGEDYPTKISLLPSSRSPRRIHLAIDYGEKGPAKQKNSPTPK